MEEFLHHYQEILTDPAHLAVELTLMLLVDVIFLGMIWPLVKRAITRSHLEIDAEHGVSHVDEPVTLSVQDLFSTSEEQARRRCYPMPGDVYDHERSGL